MYGLAPGFLELVSPGQTFKDVASLDLDGPAVSCQKQVWLRVEDRLHSNREAVVANVVAIDGSSTAEGADGAALQLVADDADPAAVDLGEQGDRPPRVAGKMMG